MKADIVKTMIAATSRYAHVGSLVDSLKGMVP